MAAIAAGMIFTIANVEATGAFAREASPISLPTSDSQITEEVVPVFVASETVQPLPADQAEDDAAPLAHAHSSAVSLDQLVSRTSTDENLSEELRCLAGAIYFESRGEPLDGQLAVAQVIINRAESGRFPSSYCGVVKQRSQFSFVRNGRIPAPRAGSNAWKKAKAVARIAHGGLWDSAADDALYFHAKYVRPSWSRTKTARATIDSHIFYR